MSDEKDIDDTDLQQDSPAEAISEVTDPDGQEDDDILANRIIAVPGAGGAGAGGPAGPAVTRNQE